MHTDIVFVLPTSSGDVFPLQKAQTRGEPPHKPARGAIFPPTGALVLPGAAHLHPKPSASRDRPPEMHRASATPASLRTGPSSRRYRVSPSIFLPSTPHPRRHGA